MTGIILAGGLGIRLHRDKTFLKVGGLPVIERMLKVMRDLFKSIIIVTNTPEPFKTLGAITIPDKIPRKGSLVGLYSGLLASPAHFSFVFACDMPFLNPSLIRHMMERVGKADALVPKIKGEFEPLHAIYSRNCIEPICRLIDKNDMRILNFYPDISLVVMEEDEIKMLDPEGLAFFNINTKEDLSIARKIAHKHDKKD